MVLGVAVVSNVLKWALQKHETLTLGTLMGLLVGAVVGLWPFQKAVEPTIGLIVKGRALTKDTIATVDVEDLPTVFFTPSPMDLGMAVLLILVGFGFTYGVSTFGPKSSD